MANFVSKFPKFSYYGNKGRSFQNYNKDVKFRDPENPLFGARFLAICYLCYVLKNLPFYTLVTMTMTSEVENSKKLDYHIFTCKFPISYITMSADHDIPFG